MFWKISRLQTSHDSRRSGWIRHSFCRSWIILTVLSPIFVFMPQSLRREEDSGTKILRGHERISDSSLKKIFSLLVKSQGTTHLFHGPTDLLTSVYSEDAVMNRSPATFSLQTNVSFSLLVGLVRVICWSCTVDSNWCWQFSQNAKENTLHEQYFKIFPWLQSLADSAQWEIWLFPCNGHKRLLHSASSVPLDIS